MRKNVKLISAVITVILFFILNGIMSSVDFEKPETSMTLAIVVSSLVGGLLLILLFFYFRGRREKII